MKKMLGLLAVSVMIFPGCLKNKGCEYNECANTAPGTERAMIATYLEANSITATEHCSGVYYIIQEPGTGKRPDACATIRVKYRGTLQNGSEFDANNNFVYSLSGLIKGWQNTIPMLKVGGKMVIYVPPTLAYGPQGYPPDIPANEFLIFEIELLEV